MDRPRPPRRIPAGKFPRKFAEEDGGWVKDIHEIRSTGVSGRLLGCARLERGVLRLRLNAYAVFESIHLNLVGSLLYFLHFSGSIVGGGDDTRQATDRSFKEAVPAPV
jgi:hypothetical protein